MVYTKYIPYLFLIIALVFGYTSVERYREGGDGLPHLLLSVCAVGYFFVKRYMYKQRYNNPKQ
ncbi:hypothetical protein ACLI09_10800 [Flavobacterium sp. RHBU_24]|uniref:hypothetical protein n=1 Tax=Flavobacterium sp. RHBU_24 TaxID=3391185 RepID=UPI0039850F4D